MILHPEHSRSYTHSLYVALGEDPVIVELARPLSHGSAQARELERNGEMIYSVTFRLADLDAGIAHLRDCGLEPSRQGDGSVVLDASQAVGAVFGFSGEDVPDDPRV